MDIINFDRIRIGGNCPFIFDISTIDYDPPDPPFHYHEKDGLCAVTYDWGEGYIEIRRTKDGKIAILNCRYNEMPIPEWLRDAEVLWTNRENTNTPPAQPGE